MSTAPKANGASTGPGKGPRSVIGLVVSNKMQKTVVVAVQSTITHPQYKKVVRRTTRYMAHDEHSCQVGDRVQLVETRPLSKRKRWRVVSIIERGPREVPVLEETVTS